jgi:DNA-binding transcriptional LysR family regulator
LIVKAPDYEFTTAGDFKLEDLASARILLTTKDCTFRLLFERVLGVGKVFLNNVLELGSIEAAKQCAMAGMGLAVLPKMALTAELKRNRLVTVPWSGPGFPVYAQVLRNRRRSPSPALDTLWNLAKQSFEAQSGRGRW